MIFNGKKRAEEIVEQLKEQVQQMEIPPVLAIVLVGDDIVSKKYIQKKIALAAQIGIVVQQVIFPEDITEEKLKSEIDSLNTDDSVAGIIVQLPLPVTINTETILKQVLPRKDVDALGDNPKVLTPVVGAVKDILEENGIGLSDKKIVVVGKGKLVGLPTIAWLKSQNVEVTVIDKNTSDTSEQLLSADIIISGAGHAHFIKPNMITEGVVLLDAGTSEQGGELAGDADPTCAEKCDIFTPVPGGIGPMTVVLIFSNLLALSR
ncbi:hypothetical protein COB55_02360 [Candidatus Wolfebacteria bacterium]|nr:MAG: hypothetical protein COB55_02360 [Candidatus Wolfebacteria bacterium]